MKLNSGSWWQLLRDQGLTVSWYTAVRAYFVSQIGKYVPGKAWVLLLRVGLLKSVQARPATVIVTGLYETLTSMAAGAVLGVILLPWSGLAEQLNQWQRYSLFGLALLPLAVLGLNRLVRRVASKYRSPESPSVPVPSVTRLVLGLLQATVGWTLLGLSLWLTTCGLAAEPPAFKPDFYLRCLCGVCVAYVFGFIVLVSPAGVCAREWVLQTVLARAFGETASNSEVESIAAAVAIGLRVVWTLFEMLCMLVLWLLPPRGIDQERFARAE
jgi:glycosyltransferase 2 family protein